MYQVERSDTIGTTAPAAGFRMEVWRKVRVRSRFRPRKFRPQILILYLLYPKNAFRFLRNLPYQSHSSNIPPWHTSTIFWNKWLEPKFWYLEVDDNFEIRKKWKCSRISLPNMLWKIKICGSLSLGKPLWKWRFLNISTEIRKKWKCSRISLLIISDEANQAPYVKRM